MIFTPYPEDEMELPEYKIGDNVPKTALRNQNGNRQKMSKEQQKKAIGAYMASVRFMDQQVGRLLDALDRLEVRDETIVIFISDHGYNLGEHDCWSKHSLWEGVARVPMIISYPGNKTQHGEKSETITELIDLYPTLADLCDLSEKKPEILQGKSLAGIIKGEEQKLQKSVAYTMTGKDAASVRTDRWRYNRWGEDAIGTNEELYDHKNDPEEHINLIDIAANKDDLMKMRTIFEKSRKYARNGLTTE